MTSLWVRLVLLPVLVQAQSGDLDPSTETSKLNSNANELVCTSHISMRTNNSLTCNLQRPHFNEDDEDQEDRIESIAVCLVGGPGRGANQISGVASATPSHTGGHFLADLVPRPCWNATGNSVSNITMIPVVYFRVSVRLRSGGVLTQTHDLRKIVKPKSPRVRSAVFHRHRNQVVVRIETPYHGDYLNAANQLFQYRVWAGGPGGPGEPGELRLNVTGEETLVIPKEYLSEPGPYRLKVRALPHLSFNGSWSDWSNTVQFTTGPGETHAAPPSLLVLLLLVVVGTLVISVAFSVFVRRKKIGRTLHAYMRPRAPATLGPLYKQVKLGFALTFEPEHFSHMNIQPITRVQEKPSSESQATSAKPDVGQEDRDLDLGRDPDLGLDRDPELGLDRKLSTSGTRTRSTSDPGSFTGGSSSTLLSGGSWGEMQPPPAGRTPSPSTPAGGLNLLEWTVVRCGDPGCEVTGPPHQGRDPVYVTMSSFYHRKDHSDP